MESTGPWLQCRTEYRRCGYQVRQLHVLHIGGVKDHGVMSFLSDGLRSCFVRSADVKFNALSALQISFVWVQWVLLLGLIDLIRGLNVIGGIQSLLDNLIHIWS